MTNLKLINTFDPHVHLRDPQFFSNKIQSNDERANKLHSYRNFQEIVSETAKQFSIAAIMPNAPAIDTVEKIIWYNNLIKSANETGLDFNPLVVLKIGPDTTPEIIRESRKIGTLSGKLYPDGVTTASTGGVKDFKALYPVFSEMESCGMILSIHGEVPKTKEETLSKLGIKPWKQSGNDNIYNREYRFHRTYKEIRKAFPKLKIILEHITDRRSVALVKDAYEKGHPTAATITLHHLIYDNDSMLAWPGGHGEGLNPHLYCKPIIKFPVDRNSLLWAATSGLSCFFFGSDTAPHYTHTKECDCGCAGVFSAPVLLPMLAYVFDENSAILKMQSYVSDFARDFYNIPKPEKDRIVEVVKENWLVPKQIGGVTPMLANIEIPWKVM